LYRDLSKRWNIEYEKDGKREALAKGIFAKLAEDENADVKEAIRRAEKLLEASKGLPVKDQNPITTVHLLVKKLLSFID
jgi:hypothetical protein